MPPSKRSSIKTSAGTAPGAKRGRSSAGTSMAISDSVALPASEATSSSSSGTVSIDLAALSATVSAVVTEALKTTPSSETLTGILKNTGDPIPLEPLALESSSSVGAAVTAEVADILQDGHASGSELQGHFPGSRGGSISDTREPHAEELGANLRTLLSSSLTAGSRRSYQRAWIIFLQFYRQFYGSDDPPLPVPPTCLPLFISYLTFRKLALSTITSYLSAIS